MTTRERFERKLQAIRDKYEALVDEMLETIDNLESERAEVNDLHERLEEAEAEAVA